MTHISNVFFDLDGTLTDPREGIEKCFLYTLVKLGVPVPGDFTPSVFIGPPLRTTFRRILGTDEPEPIERAVAYYRERFGTVGLYENTVYPSIPDMLEALNRYGTRVFLVTSKPTKYAEPILEHFGLDGWFNGIYGTGMDGSYDNKADLVKDVLHAFSLEPAATVMVGDRKEDVLAGKAGGTLTIGVTYGYGSRAELEQARADGICDSPDRLVDAIRGL